MLEIGKGKKLLIIIYGSDEAETDCKQCHEDVDVVDKEEDEKQEEGEEDE